MPRPGAKRGQPTISVCYRTGPDIVDGMSDQRRPRAARYGDRVSV